MRKAFVLLTVVATITLSLVSVPAIASNGEDYLALGDSVAFGFDPRAIPGPNNPNPIFDAMEPENFIGYPEALAKKLDLDVTNASCPGEASGGFISLTGVDNNCRSYRVNFPLHVDYTTSQLDFAVAFLKKHRDTKLVTLNIGANDLFVLQRDCAGSTTCVINGLPSLLNTLAANLSTIYGKIRGEGRFSGELVALTYYALDYSDLNAVAVISAINAVVAKSTLAAKGNVASGFNAWLPVAAQASGSSCAAGLLIVLSTSPLKCDVHPSPAGRDLLARAIAAQVTVPIER